MSCDIVGLSRHHQVHASFNWTAGNFGGGGGAVAKFFCFFSLSLSHIASRISCDDVGKLSQTAKKCVGKIQREFQFTAYNFHC